MPAQHLAEFPCSVAESLIVRAAAHVRRGVRAILKFVFRLALMSLQDFLSHLSEILDMPAADVQPGAKLADLEGWNSMAMVSFIAFTDEYFGKTVPVRAIASCQTIADLAALSGIDA